MAITKNSIEHVVEDGLCHRCGACIPVCPIRGCITLGADLHPRIDPLTCIECGVCERVCSGDVLRIDELKADLEGPAHAHPYLGGIHQPWVASAANPDTRSRAASGGFVTQLLVRLLEEGRIDGAIVAGPAPGAPWTGAPRIARTAAEVREATASKYPAVPMTSILEEVIGRGEERYAFVGVSCHIHALRLAIRARPHLGRKIRYVIGLFCKSAFEPDAGTDLLGAAGVELWDVAALEYRHGAWPGVMRARKKDGTHVPLHHGDFKDGAYNYLMGLYTQPRCWQCFDWSNELCDIAAGDPWGLGADGTFRYPAGETLILPRTAAGLELVSLVRSDRSFRIEPAADDYMRDAPVRFADGRARMVNARIQSLAASGLPHAVYDRTLPEVNRAARLRDRLFAFLSAVGRRKGIRRLVLQALLSRAGIFLIRLRQLLKYGRRGYREVRRLEPKIGVTTLIGSWSELSEALAMVLQ